MSPICRYAWCAALELIPVRGVSAKICVEQLIVLASSFFRPLKIADSTAVVAALTVSIGSLFGLMRPATNVFTTAPEKSFCPFW